MRSKYDGSETSTSRGTDFTGRDIEMNYFIIFRKFREGGFVEEVIRKRLGDRR